MANTSDVPTQKIRVAAAHAAPVFMNKKATTDKVIKLIEQAGEEKIELLVFPETFIPGYPVSQHSIILPSRN
jgi:nitrilase